MPLQDFYQYANWDINRTKQFPIIQYWNKNQKFDWSFLLLQVIRSGKKWPTMDCAAKLEKINNTTVVQAFNFSINFSLFEVSVYLGQ